MGLTGALHAQRWAADNSFPAPLPHDFRNLATRLGHLGAFTPPPNVLSHPGPAHLPPVSHQASARLSSSRSPPPLSSQKPRSPQLPPPSPTRGSSLNFPPLLDERDKERDRARELVTSKEEREKGEKDETVPGKGGETNDILHSIFEELKAIKQSNIELKEDQQNMQSELLRLRHENYQLKKQSAQLQGLGSLGSLGSPLSGPSSLPRLAPSNQLPLPPLPSIHRQNSTAFYTPSNIFSSPGLASASPNSSSHWANHSWTPKTSTNETKDNPSNSNVKNDDKKMDVDPGNGNETTTPFVVKDALKPFAILKKVGDDGFFILANSAFCSLYHYTLSELVGQSWRILIPEHEQSATKEAFLPLLQKTTLPTRVSRIMGMRAQHQTKDGVLIDTVTKHQMFYDEHGKPYWDVLYVDSYTLASNPPTPGSLARKEIPESAAEIKNGKNPAKSEPAIATTAKMLDPAPPSAAQPQQPPSAEQNASFYQPNSSSSSSQW